MGAPHCGEWGVSRSVRGATAGRGSGFSVRPWAAQAARDAANRTRRASFHQRTRVEGGDGRTTPQRARSHANPVLARASRGRSERADRLICLQMRGAATRKKKDARGGTRRGAPAAAGDRRGGGCGADPRTRHHTPITARWSPAWPRGGGRGATPLQLGRGGSGHPATRPVRC